MRNTRFPFAQAPTGLHGRRVAYSNGGATRPEAYRDFSATELYCPKCRRATPVREKMLLVLPDGDLYDYLCSECGTSVGSRKA